MDPFDEFEFKPITEGLGFHGKEIPKQSIREKVATKATNASLDSLDHQEMNSTFNTILPREMPNDFKESTNQYENNSSETVDDILKTLQQKSKFEFKRPESFINEEFKTEVYLPSAFDFSAAILDSMLIVAAYLLSLIMMLVITRVDLFSNLLTPDENGMVYIAMAAHFAVLTWVYLVANRIFIGSTPGEWVFDQMLGNPDYVGKANYSLRVALRSSLIIATGFVVLPILSMITGKDVAGQISGVQLFKRP